MNSTYTLGPEQADGRREVVESHVDGTGKIHEARYLADQGTDYESVMSARALSIQQQLQVGEARNAVKALIDSQIGAGTYDATKEMCVQLGVEFVQLGWVSIDVRTNAPVVPEDEELAAAYTASGRDWTSLVNVIKAMGVDSVTLTFKKKITL